MPDSPESSQRQENKKREGTVELVTVDASTVQTLTWHSYQLSAAGK
jgi:hypothetical protein